MKPELNAAVPEGWELLGGSEMIVRALDKVWDIERDKWCSPGSNLGRPANEMYAVIRKKRPTQEELVSCLPDGWRMLDETELVQMADFIWSVGEGSWVSPNSDMIGQQASRLVAVCRARRLDLEREQEAILASVPRGWALLGQDNALRTGDMVWRNGFWEPVQVHGIGLLIGKLSVIRQLGGDPTEFHASRRMFAIIEGCPLIAQAGDTRGHGEWLVALFGLRRGREIYREAVRGYYRNGELFVYTDTDYRVATRSALVVSGLCLVGEALRIPHDTKVHSGVRPGLVGVRWEPIHYWGKYCEILGGVR
jgi:hypothetical protein